MPDVLALAEGLSVGYGRDVVVGGIELRLSRGETIALVGVNGSGKSTLLKTLAGLLPPLEGRVEIVGAEPLAQPERVAYLGQFHPTSMALPLRAVDVVRMARFSALGLFGRFGRDDEAAVWRALRAMDADSLADLPLNRLSGGQRQRVFIAQALAREADLLLLDEPAAGLDAQATGTYRRLVRAAADEGSAVVVATHDIDEAAACDATMLLARRVVACGPSAEVLSPAALLATFGVIGRYREGGLVAVGREHGHGDACEDHEER
jgi:ABC-type Mn2+/Zn2+ transport system ATPase subunit